MLLTAVLRRGRSPGRHWIGKHRRQQYVSEQAKQNMIHLLEIEAENQCRLSTPYTSTEQEYGHAAERRAIKAAIEAIKAACAAKFPPHRFAAD
ncbi:ribosomal protein 63, mitochondrial-like [Octodon degus]|uniref:Ribosomal protein 63, mitochondrial-like n=1 Tax=Octodon degus TaxID=10160 RepID=A0A6P3VEG6_OCTDE|nr:ribosomal protein 63, mitochondrial-like [Octodon degus]